MNQKILLLVTILILAFSTSVFADGETGAVGGETGQSGYCGETGQVGGCGGETGAGNLFGQFLNLF